MGLEGILKSVKDSGYMSEFGTSSEHPKDDADVDDVGIFRNAQQ